MVLLAPGAAPGLVSEFFCPSISAISPSLDFWQRFFVGFVAVGSKTPVGPPQASTNFDLDIFH